MSPKTLTAPTIYGKLWMEMRIMEPMAPLMPERKSGAHRFGPTFTGAVSLLGQLDWLLPGSLAGSATGTMGKPMVLLPETNVDFNARWHLGSKRDSASGHLRRCS